MTDRTNITEINERLFNALADIAAVLPVKAGRTVSALSTAVSVDCENTANWGVVGVCGVFVCAGEKHSIDCPGIKTPTSRL